MEAKEEMNREVALGILVKAMVLASLSIGVILECSIMGTGVKDALQCLVWLGVISAMVSLRFAACGKIGRRAIGG